MTNAGTSPQSKTALVTGASAGIGYELARLFALGGYDLVLVSRDKAKLEEVAAELEATYDITGVALSKDLTVPVAPEEILQELQRHSIDIDVLVNNAGFGTHGPFHESDMEKELSMIRLNVNALAHLTRLFLPQMVDRGSGKILNVTSTAAFQPGPLMAVYYATKAFVLSFSEAIASELKGTGVTVTALCPGPTRTGFQKRAGAEHTRLAGAGLMMEASTVAKTGYRGLMKNKRVVIPGLKNRLLAALSARFFPRGVVLKVVTVLNRNR